MERDLQTLIDSLGALPIAMVLSNPRRVDNPLEIVNPAFCTLTGYSEQEIVGRNCRFLTGPATDPASSEHCRASIRDRRPAMVDILNYRSDGQLFRNGVTVAPLYGADGEIEYFLGSQVDLGDALSSSGRRAAAAAASRRCGSGPTRTEPTVPGGSHRVSRTSPRAATTTLLPSAGTVPDPAASAWAVR